MRQSCLALLLSTVALPAAADVTPEDVWSGYEALLGAFGLDVSVTESREGAALVLSDIMVSAALPEGIGTLSFAYGPVRLTDLGDGSVGVAYPEAGVMTAILDLPGAEFDQFRGELDLAVSVDGAEIVASGTPEDIVSRSSYGRAQISLSRLALSGEDEILSVFDADAVQFDMSVEGSEAASRLRQEADLIYVESQSDVGVTTYDFAIEMPDLNTVQTQSGGTASAKSSAALALPRGGIDWLDLATAIRTGLSLEVQTVSAGTTSAAVTDIPSELRTEQTSSTDVTRAAFALNEGGLKVSVGTEGTTANFSMPDVLPVEVDLALASAEFDLAAPLLSTGQAQTARYAIALDGLELNDQIYRLADPAELLPREPISLDLDMSAELRLLADLVDFLTIGAMIDSGQTPVEVESVSLNAGDLSAIGAALTSSGQFTLDFGDMDSFDGFPRPAGQAGARITGLNAVLDTLIEIGLVTVADARNARLGLSMFTEAVGDDTLESTVEVTNDGQVLVNGVRMR